ncbi:MAG TPA: hypothetical protein VFB34_13545 [Chloroflexota bacterium]|nr:hypothetical protein [Chloroflexota bacterium]
MKFGLLAALFFTLGTGLITVAQDVQARSWNEHDRAVYVVSTLNAPVCPSGEQLSTVLWQRDKARIFAVLKSKTDAGLYYIAVRRADHHLVGVYAYRFGWKLPQGVKKSRCVALASSPIVTGFKNHDFRWVESFHTTYPS